MFVFSTYYELITHQGLRRRYINNCETGRLWSNGAINRPQGSVGSKRLTPHGRGEERGSEKALWRRWDSNSQKWKDFDEGRKVKINLIKDLEGSKDAEFLDKSEVLLCKITFTPAGASKTDWLSGVQQSPWEQREASSRTLVSIPGVEPSSQSQELGCTVP